MERSDGSTVWGVVYQIDELELGFLDRREGYNPSRPDQKNSYFRKEMRVLRDGEDGNPLTVWTYIGKPEAKPPAPSTEYKQFIVNGAKHWHLPKAYIQQLENIKVA